MILYYNQFIHLRNCVGGLGKDLYVRSTSTLICG